MKIGITCPYRWDMPGGVQQHILGLAEACRALGQEVSVIAPGDDEKGEWPPYVVAAGRAVPVPYNGSVSRITFGPVSNARVRRWLKDGDFEVLHVHEPATPSLSLLACFAAEGPIVATFHSANPRSRLMSAMEPALKPALEKIRGRIAVSAAARRTIVDHFGYDAVVVPNGVDVEAFRAADSLVPAAPGVHTLGFLGRLDEPRKGLAVLLDGFTELARRRPDVRLLVAGPGDTAHAAAALPGDVADRVSFLGLISDADKARFYRSVDVFVAPNLGQESFGIVLLEAMASGTPVLASDIAAFRHVLDEGRVGALFRSADPASLATEASALLDDEALQKRLVRPARAVARAYDWNGIARQVLAVYETITAAAEGRVTVAQPPPVPARASRPPRPARERTRKMTLRRPSAR